MRVPVCYEILFKKVLKDGCLQMMVLMKNIIENYQTWDMRKKVESDLFTQLFLSELDEKMQNRGREYHGMLKIQCRRQVVVRIFLS